MDVSQEKTKPQVASSAMSPALEQHYRLPPLLQRLLQKRGFFEKATLDLIFSPQLKDLRHPMVLVDMDVACERLVRARLKQEKICIYADFDLDGTSGLALLKMAFAQLGYDFVMCYQPKRLSEGYGVHVSAIQEIASQGVSLIVTVDVGITAVEAIDEANRLKVDVIITDHHLPKEILPKALAIINPNREECTSQLGHLCGAGVAFYLALALKNRLKEAGVNVDEFQPKSLLDCLTIGTLTDMVPLIAENRVLVKHGLIQLENTSRPGLQALKRSLGLAGRPLSCQDVAIRLAPKLNALSRMEMGIMPIDIFLETDVNRAEFLIEKVLEQNQKRKTLQSRAEEDGFEQHRDSGEERFAWVYSKDYHKGVIGLVATKLAQEFGVPSFVGSVTDDGKVVGSCRMPSGTQLSLLDALGAAEKTLNRFGGHAAAAGFELNWDQVGAFKCALQEYFASQSLVPASVGLEYDAEGSLSELNEEFMRWYEAMRPFGVGFPVPKFRFKQIVIREVTELRGGHRKLKLCDAIVTTQKFDAICFAPLSSSLQLALAHLSAGRALDIIAEPQWNYFAGRKTLQLIVFDAILPS